MYQKHMCVKTLGKQCFSFTKYGTCVFWYVYEMNQKYMFLQWKHCKNTWIHWQNSAFHVSSMVHVFSNIHVRCTKSTCLCSKNTVKTHKNTSKTVDFIYNVWHMCIIVYMWNESKVHVSEVNTNENTSKTVHFMY
jgi:hypothetical protein